MALGINTFQNKMSSIMGGIGVEQQNALMKKSAEDVAKQLGIPVQDVLNYMGMQNMGFGDLGTTALNASLEKYGSPSGGGGGSSSFSLGVDPAQEFNQTMEFNRESSIADFIGNIISQEVQRKGLALSTGADLIKQYQDAMANAMPSNLKVVPGFENNGMVSKMGRMMGVDTSGIMQSAQNPEFGTIPFSTLSDQMNEYNAMTPESQIEKYRPLIEQMFKEQQPLETMQTSGSGSWDSSGGMEQPSGVSPEIATTLMDAMQTRLGGLFGGGTPKTTTAYSRAPGRRVGIMDAPLNSTETKAASDAWAKQTGNRKAMTEKWMMTYIKNYRIRKRNQTGEFSRKDEALRRGHG